MDFVQSWSIPFLFYRIFLRNSRSNKVLWEECRIRSFPWGIKAVLPERDNTEALEAHFVFYNFHIDIL